MPFIVRTRTGMAAEQIGQGLQQGLLAYMQGAKMANDANLQRQKLELQRNADARAKAANIRAEAAEGRAVEKHEEWKGGAKNRELAEQVKTVQAKEFLSPEQTKLRELTAEVRTQEGTEFMHPDAVAARKELPGLRLELTKLEKEAKDYAKKTRPTPEEVKEETERGVRIAELRESILAREDTAKTAAQRQAEAAEAQWPTTLNSTVRSLESQIGPLPSATKDAILSRPYAGPEGVKSLEFELGAIASEWGGARLDAMRADVKAWGEDELLSTVDGVATQVIAKVKTGDPTSVRSAESSLRLLKRNAAIKKEAEEWKASDEVVKEVNEKLAPKGWMPVDRSDAEAQKRWEYKWNDLQGLLIKLPEVQADGTVSYDYDYGEVLRYMKALLALDPQDPATRVILEAIPGPPGSGLEAGGVGFGLKDTSVVDPSTASVSSAATKALDAEYMSLVRSLGTRGQSGFDVLEERLEALDRAIENIDWFSEGSGAGSQRSVQNEAEFYTEIERLAGPDAAQLLLDDAGAFDIQRLHYVLSGRLRKQLEANFRIVAPGPGLRPTGFGGYIAPQTSL